MLPSRYAELQVHYAHAPGSQPVTCRFCADDRVTEDERRQAAEAALRGTRW